MRLDCASNRVFFSGVKIVSKHTVVRSASLNSRLWMGLLLFWATTGDDWILDSLQNSRAAVSSERILHTFYSGAGRRTSRMRRRNPKNSWAIIMEYMRCCCCSSNTLSFVDVERTDGTERNVIHVANNIISVCFLVISNPRSVNDGRRTEAAVWSTFVTLRESIREVLQSVSVLDIASVLAYYLHCAKQTGHQSVREETRRSGRLDSLWVAVPVRWWWWLWKAGI